MLTENDFIFHEAFPDWGHTFHIMERSGLGFGRAYIYNNDPTTIYLDMLAVDPCARGDKIGTKLQELREQIGINLGCFSSVLWVDKDTWMYEWYKRRGYLYEIDKNKKQVWMKKSLL